PAPGPGHPAAGGRAGGQRTAGPVPAPTPGAVRQWPPLGERRRPAERAEAVPRGGLAATPDHPGRPAWPSPGPRGRFWGRGRFPVMIAGYRTTWLLLPRRY